MKKLRFEISKTKINENEEQNILTVYLLDGDFSTGNIRNVCFSFTDFENLQKILNLCVNKILEGK